MLAQASINCSPWMLNTLGRSHGVLHMMRRKNLKTKAPWESQRTEYQAWSRHPRLLSYHLSILMRERTLLDGASSTRPRHLQRRKQSLIRSKGGCHASMRNVCKAASLKFREHNFICRITFMCSHFQRVLVLLLFFSPLFKSFPSFV